VVRTIHHPERTMKSRRIALFATAAVLSTAAASPLAAQPAPAAAQTEQAAPRPEGIHDFDFLMGRWTSTHRKLRKRLANNHQWDEFKGTLYAQKLMDGQGNVDDNVFFTPQGTYRGVGLRAYDAKSDQWSIWWLDSRFPLGPVEPPVRGRFVDGVGTFLADDQHEGKPVKLRFIWSGITATTAHWEQALSADGGKTWETNWTMEFTRVE
jgi:hypothetical protein